MSLLDDASIVVTPNGYKQGVLFSVIPSSGAADLEVTRGTAATRVDENGLVNYAEVIGGEEIATPDFSSSTGWSFTNSGGSNGWIIDAGRAICDSSAATPYRNLNSTFSLVNGKSYRLIIDILQSADNMKIVVGGITLSETLPTGTNLNYEYFIPESAHSGGGFTIYAGSSDLQEIDNVSVKEVTRDNVPRIDYTGGGCPHILAEPMRTNLITYSSDFSQWIIQSGITITTNTTDTLSPSGLNDASKVVSTDNTKGFYLIPASTTSDVTRTIYLKGSVGGESVTLKDGGGFGGTVTHTLTTEWARYEFKTTNDGNTYKGLYVDDISVGTIYAWAAQFEEGSYATSYIPTSGITVTRNQDIFTRDGIGSLINSTEGVLFVEMAVFENGGSDRIISLSDGTNNNLMFIRLDNTASRIVCFARGSGGSYNILTVNGVNQTDNNKIALVWDATNVRVWINGSESITATINNSPVGMNTFNLADPTSASTFFGKVKQLQVYDTALSPTQLAALTS
jgi:hypothetical protein